MGPEEWRSVVGFEGLYSVSNHGRLRRDGGGRGTRAGRLLKPWRPTNDYLTVTLHRDGKPWTRLLHYVIMEAFVGPVPEGHRVRYRNGDRFECCLTNLEYFAALPEDIAHARELLSEASYRERNRAELQRKARIYARNHNRKRFGLTIRQFIDMVHAHGDRCDICRRPVISEPRPGRAGTMDKAHLDHDHRFAPSDRLGHRGILCGACNLRLGFAENRGIPLSDAERRYLEAFEESLHASLHAA